MILGNSDVSVTIQPPSSVNGCTKHSDDGMYEYN